MRLHSYIITTLACLLPLLAQAQNVPILTETAPAGSPTDSITSDLSIFSTSGGLNYVRTFIPKVPISDISNVTESSPAAAVQVSTLYKDGFLRDIMGIQRSFIDVSGQVKALVQPIPASFLPGSQSYLPYTATSGGFASLAFPQQKSYYLGMYPGEYSQSFGATQYLSNDTMRAAVSYAPGLSQIGQGRGTTTRQVTNAAYQVLAWKINSSGMPVSDGAYAANELFGTRTTGSQGLEITEFKDKDGRLVCRTVLQNTIASPPDITQVRGTTTYIYDRKGQLRYIFPPRVSAYASGSPSQTVIDNMCYSYFYENGLLVAQRFPGQAGPTEIVYDPQRRPVMRRSPLEKSRNQWEVTFYDKQGRVSGTSLYGPNTDTRIALQDLMDNGVGSNYPFDLSYYLMTPAGHVAPPTESAVYGNTMMSYTYYDDYSRADANNDFWYAYDNTLQMGAYVSVNGVEPPSRSYATQGRVTGSRIRILPSPAADTAVTGDWRESALFYDQKGRVFYTANRDLYQGNVIHAALNGSLYDFSNKVLFSKQVLQHGQSQDGGNGHTEVTRYDYDMMTGRPTRTRHSMDGGGWQDLGRFQYDGMGRVRRNIIGNYSEVQDQDYNIRGQLTGINATYAETGNKEGENRTFGESLKYDYGFVQPRYDGKIAGMVWRGAGGTSAKANAYGYTYDNSGRLTGADYYRREPAGGIYLTPAWRKDLADYSVSGLNYDLDGNIRDMIQMGVVSGGVTELDNLHYTYDATGSQLLHVSDDVTTDYGLGDFQDGNTSSTDYTYDPNGNLTVDQNKAIDRVEYTYFNKPYVVSFKNKTRIEYSYDAAGNKVQELIHSDTPKHTDYIGNFVYTNDTVQYALTPGGRTTFKITGTGITNKEEFFVKDHLGNVRSVTDLYTYPVEEYLAGYEIASANLENLFFERIDEVRDDKPGSTWIDDLKSARLNGGDPSRRIGTSLLVHVMAGDMVEMNVNNFYDGYNPADDAPLDPSTMLSSIAGTLTGGSGGYVGGEQHNTSLVSSVFNSTNYTAFDAQVKAGTDTSKPRAYLNYLLFDESKQLVASMSGSFQANGNGTWTAIGTTQPLTVPQNGYLAVYLSNSTHVTGCLNCGDVFFDQLVFRLSRGNLKEENHYYPFGLPIAGLSSTAPDLKEQRRKYQSNEYIKDLGLNWMDFHARQYDPQIGRFLGVDPLADAAAQEEINPYAAMGNAPESMIDPNGESANSFSDYDKISRALSALTTSYGDGIFVNGNFISNKDQAIGFFKEVMAQAAGGGCLMSNELLWLQSNELLDNLENGVDGAEEKVNGITVRAFPASGIFSENGYDYDLLSFDKFYEDNKQKYLAKYLGTDNGAVNLTTQASSILIDGKPGNWYAEVGSQLSSDPVYNFIHHTTLITAGANADYHRIGTSYYANSVNYSDMYVPLNSVDATIHLHNTPGVAAYQLKSEPSWIFHYADFHNGDGPTRFADYPNALIYSGIRNVMVNEKYIFLSNPKPSQDVIFKRPK